LPRPNPALTTDYYYQEKFTEAFTYYLKAKDKAENFKDTKTITNRLNLIRPYVNEKFPSKKT